MSSVYYVLSHQRIPLEAILSATNNFAEENVIGESWVNKRYKGQLLWSGELIEIDARRLNKDLDDGEQMFWMEISRLSTLKHKNLVSLVGFCDDNDEKIIIYRHETRGGLNNYLSDPMLLTWVRRLEISLGVAHALSYIHYYDESCDFSMNFDSATVLLNDDWEPKLSCFEVSMKIEASRRHNSFHTHKLQHTYGYGDPTYIEAKSVSQKSDIYSFGIVLLELLCGRKSIITNDQDNKYLVPVVLFHHREKILNDIIDPNLWKQMDPQSLKIFVETAHDCFNQERSQLSSIDEIVPRLEIALELQLERENALNEHSIVAADTASTHQKVITCQINYKK
ncbi:protein kinase-like domain, Concanavalin A-like lectin/glucanase domain protein [Artemisia annua]|uniref:Protein kinase-like domain, Concanavalin A-like lectin/glucanase domain protein n=1 Tax=Artemisia annua TaxID=35608 RepID=A0A2U1KHJ9_ARTAN|nr:protein kinase-like domain, Concanavalin A-like lectin/glucanase domain protein [Artemisia annua]